MWHLPILYGGLRGIAVCPGRRPTLRSSGYVSPTTKPIFLGCRESLCFPQRFQCPARLRGEQSGGLTPSWGYVVPPKAMRGGRRGKFIPSPSLYQQEGTQESKLLPKSPTGLRRRRNRVDEGSEKPDIHGDELSSEQGMDQTPPPAIPSNLCSLRLRARSLSLPGEQREPREIAHLQPQ